MHPKQERDVRLTFATSAVFVIAFLLGYWGWSRVHERLKAARSPDEAAYIAQHFLGRIYLSLQLFVLHPQGLPSHDPWQLDVARLVAPMVLAVATLYLLSNAFGIRARHFWIRRARRHEIVCGAGVHGQALVDILVRNKTPVVVIDVDARAPGMQRRMRLGESRLIADPVEGETLSRAGVAHAARLIAVTGDDIVNAQIASKVRDLCHSEGWRLKPVVLVQSEDRTLVRFLEDGNLRRQVGDTGPSIGVAADPERGEILEVRTFGGNALAAVALFGGGASSPTVRDPNATLAHLETMDGGHLLLAGDHGILEAIVVTALRRARARKLRESALDRGRWPLRVTLIGSGAPDYRAAIASRWQISPALIDLKATDLDPSTESAVLAAPRWSEWRSEVSHAILAFEEEHASIAAAVTLSRVLAPSVRLARIATQPKNDLDSQLAAHLNPHQARIEVVSITELAWGKEAGRVNEVPPAGRLVAALTTEGFTKEAAKRITTRLLGDRILGLQSDAAPQITPASAPTVDALLETASAGEQPTATAATLVSAGLLPDVGSRENIRRAAAHLTRSASPDAFTAWCEYARLLGPEDECVLESGGILGGAPDVLQLKEATLGTAEALERLPTDPAVIAALRERSSQRIAIFAGGATSMPHAEREAIRELLVHTLRRYDGVILTGGNDAGVCGAVRSAARLRGVPLIGYAPAGRDTDGALLMRSTAPNDFSEAEPVAMWSDILAAAKSRDTLAGAAAAVRLVAFPGGAITRTEIILARALGAAVASLDPCEQLFEPLDDLLPFGAGGVLELPSDPMTLRAFLMCPNQPLDGARRIAAARALHEQYRRVHRMHKASDDPALAPWDRLPSALQNSNLAAVDDLPNKLHAVDRRLVIGGERLRLSDEDLELLAEMEHGRYNYERLSTGWRLGRERALSRLVSPFLVPWDDLEDKVKQWDRDAILALEGALQAAGWGVAPEGDSMPSGERERGDDALLS
jgi:TrkA-N domain/RyR domain